MKDVTEYRADMLTILGDASGRRHSEDMLNMGLRDALDDYGNYYPRRETIRKAVSAVNGNDVQLQGFAPPDGQVLTVRNESGRWLYFTWYVADGKMYLRFQDGEDVPKEGDALTLEVAVSHTIKGLGAGTITTVPESHALMVAKGAAGYAMKIRARSITEVFGKRPEDREALNSQANALIREFHADLGHLSFRESLRYDPYPKRGWY